MRMKLAGPKNGRSSLPGSFPSSASLAALAVVTVGLLATEPMARADEREQCASAADQAQQLRDEGKYRRAREQLLVCARDVCPAPIKRDCLDWLTQLETVAPTVVLSAKAGTKDLYDVRVSVDGAIVTEKLDGKPLQMDLGKHTFKFEYAGQTKEEDFVIGAGQKNRSLSVTFGGAAPTVPEPAARTEEPKASVVPAAVVAGVGVLALGSFALFGLTGKSDVDDLQSCKGHCAESDVDSARTKLIVADISLGVGIVALGVATYMFLSRPHVAESGAKTALLAGRGLSGLHFDVGPGLGGAGGAAGAFGARF
ncbi:MAG: hypothetical protein JWP97_2315 [Labilithrix sp.]|nr:hypothetical protein [Labilithrix sp.]